MITEINFFIGLLKLRVQKRLQKYRASKCVG